MCGIVYTIRTDGKSASNMVLKRYNKQRHRGSQGFGYIAINNGIIENYIRETNEKDITKRLSSESASEIIFHHRFPTSTPNFQETAHPIKVSHQSLKYDYYVIHNGVISNDDELKEKHEKEGFIYTTEVVNKWRSGKNVISRLSQYNDTESLAIELAKDLDKNKNGIEHVKGSIAFIALQVSKNTRKTVRLFFGRNALNPLKINIGVNSFLTLTSEGDGDMVEAHKLYSIDYKDIINKNITDIFSNIKVINYQIGTKYTTPTYNYTSDYNKNSSFNYPNYSNWNDSEIESELTNARKCGFRVKDEEEDDDESLFLTDGKVITSSDFDEGKWYEGYSVDILNDSMLDDACIELASVREELAQLVQLSNEPIDDFYEDRIIEINESIANYKKQKCQL